MSDPRAASSAGEPRPSPPQPGTSLPEPTRRGFLSSLKRWARGDSAPVRRSKLFPDLPPFERMPAVPDDHPRVGWLPPGYRRAYVARGANSGFQVPDEIVQVFGNPRTEGGSPFTLQVYSTHTSDALLAGTHLNRNPGPARRISLLVDGYPVEADYYDGQFARSDLGTYVSERGSRFRWSRANKHSLVLSTGGLTVGIRAPRIGGIDEFHLYVMAESLAVPGAEA